LIERHGAHLPPTSITSGQLKKIRAEASELHRRIDHLTTQSRDLDTRERSNIVRRAEEAGAALARLEWALDRAIAD
jgi:hypothetical protein